MEACEQSEDSKCCYLKSEAWWEKNSIGKGLPNFFNVEVPKRSVQEPFIQLFAQLCI